MGEIRAMLSVVRGGDGSSRIWNLRSRGRRGCWRGGRGRRGGAGCRVWRCEC